MVDRKAFTLAEVLIALGIIGVIAVIVIPGFVEKANEIAWRSAAEMAMKHVEEATFQMKTQSKLTGYASADAFVDEFQNYIKIAKRCSYDKLNECFAPTIKTADGADILTTSSLTTGDKITAGTMKTAVTGINNVGLVLANGTTMLVNYNPNCEYTNAYDNRDKGTGCLVMVYDINGFAKPNQVSSVGAKTTTLDSTLGAPAAGTKDIYLVNAAISGCPGYKIGSLCVSGGDLPSRSNVADTQAIFDEIVSRYGYENPQGYIRLDNLWIGAIAACEKQGMRLPDKDELSTIYKDACGVTSNTTCADTTRRDSLGFSASYYWSSTEESSTNAWRQSFSSGSQNNYNKHTQHYARCVK